MKKGIHYIIFFLNIIVLFTLSFALVSPFVSPNIFWPISFFGLFFPLIVCMIFGFTLFWIFQNKKFIWINLIFLLFSSPYIIRFVSYNKNTEVNEGVKIMSYNVRLFNKWGWINEKNVDEKIISFVNNEKVDIFCIQEYYNPREDLNFNFKYSHIGIQKNKENWHMAIYSSYPQINKGTVHINGSEMNNTCIFSDIIVKQDTIRVYNIHLASNFFQKKDFDNITSTEKNKVKNGLIGISKKLKRSFERRGSEVDQIKEHIRKSPYSVIICGDFNDTPVSYAYQELSKKRNDAFIKSGNGIGSTYTKIPTLRIDYILYDNNLYSSDFITYNTGLSDHRAISCTINF